MVKITKFDIEIRRKMFHLLAIFYLIGYNILSRDAAVRISAMVVILGIIIELLRLKYEAINNFIKRIIGGIMRPSEKHRMSGLVWTLLGVFLTFLLYEEKRIVNAALAYLILGDMTAALVGKLMGKIKLGKKTFEGSLACFFVCLAAGIIILKKFELALVGALIATLIEFIRLPLNDNFWIPIVSGFLLTIVSI